MTLGSAQRTHQSCWRGCVAWCAAIGCAPLSGDIRLVKLYLNRRAADGCAAPGVNRARMASIRAHRLAGVALFPPKATADRSRVRSVLPRRLPPPDLGGQDKGGLPNSDVLASITERLGSVASRASPIRDKILAFRATPQSASAIAAHLA